MTKDEDAVRQQAELVHSRGEVQVLFRLFQEQHARAQEAERERDEARAGRYQLAIALGFDPDRIPLAQWMEEAKPYDQPLAERCRLQEKRFREAESEWVERFEQLEAEIERMRSESA